MKQTVLITGAGTGFGLLTAQTLLRAGYIVCAGIREPETRNARRAEELRSYAKEHDGSLEIVDLDIVKEDSCRAAVEMVVAKYDRLDVVIHNAGHLYIGVTEAFTAEQIAESVNVNALGAHRLNRAALPIMRRQGAGTLVYNGSGISRVVGPFMGPYAVGKQAFDALAEATAYEVNSFGIETVIVMPGAFTEGTSHFASHVDPEDAATLAQYARLKADQEKYDSGLEKLFEGREAPAQSVADEIARVLALPRGKRPFRTEVDFSEWGAGVCNVVAEFQTASLWGRMGLGHLLQPTIKNDLT